MRHEQTKNIGSNFWLEKMSWEKAIFIQQTKLFTGWSLDKFVLEVSYFQKVLFAQSHLKW